MFLGHVKWIPFITFKKLQKDLDCSESFIYTQIKFGRLKPRYLGRRCYFMVHEVIHAMRDIPYED
ncbi:hypothetical protein MYP_1478 [Sporocytophaga myxococcoides]|uniref:Helix-turn-helix domain-containing protein n=1 Tax=Sporocytophaga myxococcoides TaxID=153721 RepID=A0A098LBI3_9BACT|nr:hypothetical protein [Sporocytophaga myxococcoides]GAL84250.1 hypothetical protein MYP_1478 [Sporocytophaga myxococcoides]